MNTYCILRPAPHGSDINHQAEVAGGMRKYNYVVDAHSFYIEGKSLAFQNPDGSYFMVMAPETWIDVFELPSPQQEK
jgi:hypothetical protein